MKHRFLKALTISLALGTAATCIPQVANAVQPQQVQAYSVRKPAGELWFSNKYGSMHIHNIRVFKIYDEMDVYPTQYAYFVNGWFKNKGKRPRSPLSFYNRYFYDEEYYKGSYWVVDNNPLDLVPSNYYAHMTDLGQRKIPRHASTQFSLGATDIPPVRFHSNELFRVSLTPYKSNYVAARQYFTTGYMHYRKVDPNDPYNPNN